MARERVYGDGPLCSCGRPAVWSGRCAMEDGRGYCASQGYPSQVTANQSPSDYVAIGKRLGSVLRAERIRTVRQWVTAAKEEAEEGRMSTSDMLWHHDAFKTVEDRLSKALAALSELEKE